MDALSTILSIFGSSAEEKRGDDFSFVLSEESGDIMAVPVDEESKATKCPYCVVA
jgi:hypothetical protein